MPPPLSNEDYSIYLNQKQNKMEQVNVDYYFENKKWDNKFIKFLTFPIGKKNEHSAQDNLIYVLNKIKDNRILELYNVTMELKNVHLQEYHNKKNSISFNNDTGKKVKGKQRKKINELLSLKTKIIESIETQIRLLIRLMERDDTMTWLVYPLYKVSNQLYSFIKSENSPLLEKSSDIKQNDLMERCIRNIHKCLTMCLNDRNPNDSENKRCGVLYFINLEFRIYKQLGNKDMIKNLIKVYESRVNLTNNHNNDTLIVQNNMKYPIGKSQLVQFYYYMGLYYGYYVNDHVRGIKNLNLALSECSIKYGTQIKSILKLMIPLQLLVYGVTIKQDYNEKFGISKMPIYYHNLMKLILRGQVNQYLQNINDMKIQEILLKSETYIVWQLLLHRVQTNHIKYHWNRLDRKSILPLSEIPEVDECQISNLIFLGYIRGYISHSHQCMVLSKTSPFPSKQPSI